MSLRKPTTTKLTLSTKTASDSSSDDETVQQNYAAPSSSLPTRAISQTLTTTANLANLLPTGTVLAFQLLVPTFTNNGTCDSASRLMTQFLLLVLASSCFLASFTDSFKSPDGKVYYGFATFKGMWLFDSPIIAGDKESTIPELNSYRLTFVDLLHAILSVFVFLTIASRDVNVLKCFYPQPEKETQQILNIAPVGVGVLCGLLFVVFPTRRHGIGYPVSSGN